MPRQEPGLSEATGLSGAASLRAAALQDLAEKVRGDILAGFDYVVDGETLHFSYDATAQQNFADEANAALLALQRAADPAPVITCNGHRADGETVRLELTPEAFLDLYTLGALAHKNAHRDRFAELKESATLEELRAACL